MKLLVAFSLYLCVTGAIPSRPELARKWNDFKRSHGRHFATPREDNFRRSIFQTKLREIEAHNTKYDQGLETYKMDINRFSDFTDEELYSYTHGLQPPAEEPHPYITISSNSTLIVTRSSIPVSLDWRTSGMVTPVKSQKSCGSCWAFSTTGALESHYKIYQGSIATLSEQQLVDCMPEYGCNGGWMTDAYNYIKQNGGINYDSDYPYEGEDNACRYQPSKAKVTIQGYASLADPDEDLLQQMVATKGPVSVAIDASGNFARYGSGVYYNPTCSTHTFTHAVVVVGYGVENGLDYWLVKNSWGSDWGLDGYIKMARNRGNHCGIASKASYPVF